MCIFAKDIKSVQRKRRPACSHTYLSLSSTVSTVCLIHWQGSVLGQHCLFGARRQRHNLCKQFAIWFFRPFAFLERPSHLGAGRWVVPGVLSAGGCEMNCCLCLVCSCSYPELPSWRKGCCTLRVCVTLWVVSTSSGHILGWFDGRGFW